MKDGRPARPSQYAATALMYKDFPSPPKPSVDHVTLMGDARHCTIVDRGVKWGWSVIRPIADGQHGITNKSRVRDDSKK